MPSPTDTADTLSTDLTLLRGALEPLEVEARELPWAHQRPWRVRSHVRPEGELIQVDLHDLNARCARQAVRLATERAEDLHTGAVGFITGVGSHSIGPGVLGEVTARELRTQCKRHGWSYHPNGKGALVLVTDPSRAPARATSQLPPLFWLVAALFLGAIAWIAPLTAIPMVLTALVVGWRWWSKRKPRNKKRTR